MKKNEIKFVLKQFDSMILPDKDKIISACEKVEIEKDGAKVYATKKTFKKRPRFAICVAVIVILCILTFGTIAEAKQYNTAIKFFEEYDLSTVGLNRSDIKAVYKDITTGKFECDKTVEVIRKRAGGYEIFQENPTPNDIESVWNYIKNWDSSEFFKSKSDNENCYYEYGYSEKKDKDIISKYIDDEKVWSVEFDDLIIEDYVNVEDKILVFGSNNTTTSYEIDYAWITMINSDGKIEWQKKLENDFESEYIGEILVTEKQLIVFSRGNWEYLCISKYDMNGNRQSFVKNKIGSWGISNAANLGNGYMLKLWDYENGEKIVKIKDDGTIDDTFSYSSETENYSVMDMIEFNGMVYLSAYAFPKISEDNYAREIQPILDYIYEKEDFDISSKKLTEMVRDNYTAILFVCERDTGIPEEFYSVKGSLGGTLSLSDKGNLLWKVESITDTELSLLTSSYTIGGASHVYQYTFDNDGKLLSQEKTGEIEIFRR